MVKSNNQIESYNLKEEIANAITHGVGTLLAIAGLVILLVLADNIHFPGYLIYGVSLVLLYLASTLYHCFSHLSVKRLFQKFDHMAIFLLIAGTYTPYCLNVLDGTVRWVLLGIVWACAVLGILLKCFFTGRLEWLSLTLYILMGWMAIFVIKPIYDSLPFLGFLFLITGGVAYTIGTLFYVNTKIKFSHSIWHLWVLAGSTFHFFSIMMLM